MSTVVTPCCGIGSHVGSQNSVGSKCVCESMNPGATVAPPASSTRSPAAREVGCDLGDDTLGNADVSPLRRRAGPVDDLTAADEEPAHCAVQMVTTTCGSSIRS